MRFLCEVETKGKSRNFLRPSSLVAMAVAEQQKGEIKEKEVLEEEDKTEKGE